MEAILLFIAFLLLTAVNSYIYIKRRKRKKVAIEITESHFEPVFLEDKHLQHCIVLPNRNEILKILPKNAIVAEVGVLAGDFSERILQRTNPRQLYLIDTFFSRDWIDNKDSRFIPETHLRYIETRFREAISKGQVHIRKGMSWDMLKQFEDNFFDWIYIDAGHTYTEVYKDLQEAKRITKPNGYIIMNDYIYYSSAEQINYGVIQAVNELCVKDNFEITHFALHPQMYCDVVLKRIV